MSQHSRTILLEKGFTVEHEATVLDASDLKCDFLLCMEQRHIEFCSRKITTDTHPEMIHLDIPDPYGGSLEDYQKVFDEIQKSIDRWFFNRFLAKEA
jgi:protein-tyrosine-phosphatase